MDQMQALRQEYLSSAEARVSEMEQFLAAGAIDELKSAAHKLAGSGGFYGFDAISNAGRALEVLIVGKAGREALAAGLAALVEAVRSAR